jgi:predicted small lipoprotein YifL
MKTIVGSFVVVAIALSLTGCSDKPSDKPSGKASDQPTVAQARTQLEGEIKEQSGGLIKLVSFEKTDGKAEDFGGAKSYEMSYTAEVEFMEDCTWNRSPNAFSQYVFSAHSRAKHSKADLEGDRLPGFKSAKKEERAKISGKMEFEKTERGWHVHSNG